MAAFLKDFRILHNLNKGSVLEFLLRKDIILGNFFCNK